ncbi:MAG TPA: hypothetical protein VFG87_13345 [Amycolatopsis sp.]|jgi:hypothetical protein|nr:hypothetical protein [Amycolatopsis sp.]
MATNDHSTAGSPAKRTNNGHARDTAASSPGAAPDRKWPLWARILVGVLLTPVGAAALMAAENDFAGLGLWFDPIMIGLMVLAVAVVWAVSGRAQR